MPARLQQLRVILVVRNTGIGTVDFLLNNDVFAFKCRQRHHVGGTIAFLQARALQMRRTRVTK
jgi:hypothetical protein